jgi:hypothetical protein
VKAFINIIAEPKTGGRVESNGTVYDADLNRMFGVEFDFKRASSVYAAYKTLFVILDRLAYEGVNQIDLATNLPVFASEIAARDDSKALGRTLVEKLKRYDMTVTNVKTI